MASVGALLVFLLMFWRTGDIRAANTGFTTLDVDGEQVRIYRDEYGVPHIFAETNKGLFQGYGYAIAQDRLWQLELNRAASLGRLSELFGATPIVTNIQRVPPATALAVDTDIRTRYYSDAERQAQFALLNDEEVEIFTSYADGINRYVNDVIVPDIAHKLPFEFQYLGIGVPRAWTALDVTANAIYQTRFGLAGGNERANQTLLTSLTASWGAATAMAIYNDMRWIDDPDTPFSVPAEGPFGRRQKADPPSSDHLDEQMVGAREDYEPSMQEKADAVLEALGVPIHSGSHGWVVSPAKSANGSAMLFGGPQVAFNTPELFHEAHLIGGNGFNVMGRAFAGVPIIFSGRTDQMAWTMSSGVFADNIDIYVETLCGGGTGYLFNGVCTPFEQRPEVINVKGGAPVTITVRITVHGPVVATGTGVVYTQKRYNWQRDIVSQQAFIALNRANNLQEFLAAAQGIEEAHNVLYADKQGNIAYLMPAKVPIRPAGFDPRFPLPGTGIAEWTGDVRPMPMSINPERGWLTTWNSKPAFGYPNPDQRSFGKAARWTEIDRRLAAPGTVSLDDMKNIAKDIARTRTGGDGREARYVTPYLLAALDAVPPANPLASQAKAVLAAWDGSLFDDAVSSTRMASGQVIFAEWLSQMMTDTFADELGAQLSLATSNMLIHVLDDRLGGGSGVPPSRDYFNGTDPNVVMSQAFDKALTTLGSDPMAWSTKPRGVVHFQHNLFPAIPEVATMLDANHGTYCHVVVLSNPHPTSESIITLGQSGFIQNLSGTPVLDPHFMDQFDLYRNFQYKPMHLYINTQLKE